MYHTMRMYTFFKGKGCLMVCLCTLIILGFVQTSKAERNLSPVYVEYTRAQTVCWIDCNTFAVGRWDGSLAVFHTPYPGENNPKMLQIRVSSDSSGIEMVSAVNNDTIIFSEGAMGIGIWSKKQGGVFDNYKRSTFDVGIGVANCATSIKNETTTTILTGHANGFVVVWEWRENNLILLRTIDLRSSNPIPSPYPLKNIRGLVYWKNGVVISASEDGDIVGFKPQDGSIVFRQRYNPSAQRGINSISLVGDRLLLTNCSVGPTDNNVWLYEVTMAGLKIVDSLNLKRNHDLSQVFAFNAELYSKSNELHFFASTQEGLLWSGSVAANKLVIDGAGDMDPGGAASLSLNTCNDFLATAAHQIYLYKPN